MHSYSKFKGSYETSRKLERLFDLTISTPYSTRKSLAQKIITRTSGRNAKLIFMYVSNIPVTLYLLPDMNHLHLLTNNPHSPEHPLESIPIQSYSARK